MNCPHVGEDLCFYPRITGALQDQKTKAVIKDMFLNGKLVARGCVCRAGGEQTEKADKGQGRESAAKSGGSAASQRAASLKNVSVKGAS
jgi:hypothetical protein